jgi:hypothetical protein
MIVSNLPYGIVRYPAIREGFWRLFIKITLADICLCNLPTTEPGLDRNVPVQAVYLVQRMQSEN